MGGISRQFFKCASRLDVLLIPCKLITTNYALGHGVPRVADQNDYLGFFQRELGKVPSRLRHIAIFGLPPGKFPQTDFIS